jgi:ubiquinone/menaquinone biosynthesis C-methylase UbiE
MYDSDPMPTETKEAQAFSVKRAEVEFHNFASLGEPERAIEAYAQENQRRGEVIRKHLKFIGEMSPFLEIGANAGHSSYMLVNEFGADGFALDLSSDALRHGIALMDRWRLTKSPVRLAGDAANLPFKDGSIRLVVTFQTLSQFMNLDSIFAEVKRVLAPGGVFLFAEEPIKRLLTLGVYRIPYYDFMKPWERKLFDWGLLGYLAQDVIGAHQEESFGIRQNHTMCLNDWRELISRHFVAQEFDLFVPERGWGERVVKRTAVRLDPHRSVWRAARLLGGTLAAVCRKTGDAPESRMPFERYETLLRCPDCSRDLSRDAGGTLACASCGYSAANEGGVYNLLRSADRAELYPGNRDDVIDFCVPGHERKLLNGWYELEGVFGGKFRWMGAKASVRLRPVSAGRQRLRVRGNLHEQSIERSGSAEMRAFANGVEIGRATYDRAGLLIFEADLPPAAEYAIELHGSPLWQVPQDQRHFTFTIGMIRLVPAE